jgi:hypothetical protein
MFIFWQEAQRNCGFSALNDTGISPLRLGALAFCLCALRLAAVNQFATGTKISNGDFAKH